MRTLPLPTGPARHRLIVPASVAEETERALRGSRGPDGPHEGLVLWAGLECGKQVVALVPIRPVLEHGWGHVHLDERAALEAVRASHSLGLGIVAQVHSHPSRDVRHSDGDDAMVFMPFDGMFSLVCAEYGMCRLGAPGTTGLHQMQAGRWVLIRDEDALVVVPGLLELP